MKELLRTNDPVLLSWVQVLLRGENIETFILDSHTSVLEGSAGAILRRLVVADDDYARARQLVTDAGHGAQLA
jgi:hypothetical protein